MKSNDILKVFQMVLGSADVVELNKLLKAKTSMAIKYKIMGEKFGYLGLTVAIKNIVPEGLKIFDVSKVRLVRFSEIESFERAKPKVPRPVRPKKVVVPEKKPQKNLFAVDKAEKELRDAELLLDKPVVIKKKPVAHKGSAFIPAKKSR